MRGPINLSRPRLVMLRSHYFLTVRINTSPNPSFPVGFSALLWPKLSSSSSYFGSSGSIVAAIRLYSSFVIRSTSARAEQLFISTYYDPSFPALYSAQPPYPNLPERASATMMELFLATFSGRVPSSLSLYRPPPSHIVFGLIPRSSAPDFLLTFLDWISILVGQPQHHADLETIYSSAAWIPS